MKFVFVVCFIATVFALDNGLALTPPMGWMPWEWNRCTVDCKNHPDSCISEKLFMDVADVMARDGYLDAGYNRINIDDCWATHERDADHTLVADPERFPHGMKALGDYIHSKNIYFGIYNDFGTLTCEGYPGSEGYLIKDAQTFASWGVDALKMDGCYSQVLDHPDAYPGMSYFLNATGRPILFSCSWPAYAGAKDNYHYYELLRKHCNLWRNYNDIRATWASIHDIMKMFGDLPYWRQFAGPGHWNDPDMIVIGMENGLNEQESRSQLAIWSILAAPLYMTNNIRNITSWAKEILLNKEVIAIDQDPLGQQGYRLTGDIAAQVWIRELVNGEYAIALLNNSDKPIDISAKFADFSKEESFVLRDLWNHKDLGLFKESFEQKNIDPHDTYIVRAVPQK
ncbi:hypothetical protein WA158_007708 [Blastocystis sp. Blastoise]